MSFKGLNFIYDGTPSEVYGLVITKMGNGEENIPGGSEVEPVTDKTFRSPVFQCFGVEQKKPLSFDIEFFCQREFDRFDLSAILLWLCGHTTYCELQICQNDLRNFYYNCLLLDPEVLYFDNKARGKVYGVRLNVMRRGRGNTLVLNNTPSLPAHIKPQMKSNFSTYLTIIMIHYQKSNLR